MARYVVGRTSELPPGSRRIVYVNGSLGIGVFNVNGTYYALKNTCPHQGAPLCAGVVTGTTRPRLSERGEPELEWCREGEIIRCPWHRWEFEIPTGRTVFRPGWRVRTYPVHVEPAASGASADEAPEERIVEGVETYPVSVEDGLVILEV